ncbi:hypothetical protein [Mesorhizobium sp. WSM4887]|uniref:hypothetical protein n=1 Tax=Mesorhizobium sp. WSM4887 TaxID=3038543 RepID=UPI0024178E87|nr:hypothetical protein [Mesorhizobium sp. WSM4887]MDG4890922.1 hypothetical protein [Mesorhizobium sp. WSM4887]
MIARVAAAKQALLVLLQQKGRVAQPKDVLAALLAQGYTREEIHGALQTAIGQNEIVFDKQLRVKAVRTLEAA